MESEETIKWGWWYVMWHNASRVNLWNCPFPISLFLGCQLQSHSWLLMPFPHTPFSRQTAYNCLSGNNSSTVFVLSQSSFWFFKDIPSVLIRIHFSKHHVQNIETINVKEKLLFYQEPNFRWCIVSITLGYSALNADIDTVTVFRVSQSLWRLKRISLLTISFPVLAPA